jgi:hypothetical protein
MQKGKPTDRRSRQHVAKFILVALYTGTRASAVCAAALGATEGKGWIDLDKGIFYRRPRAYVIPKSAGHPHHCPVGFWRTYGGGNGQGNALPWSGTARPCETWTRPSAMSLGRLDFPT